MSVRTMFLALALALTPRTGAAAIYTGNPLVNVKVDRLQQDLVSGSVGYAKLRMEYCGGGYTDYPVASLINPVAGATVQVSAGDYCGVTLFWGSTMALYGDDFGLTYASETTYVAMPTAQQTVALSPVTVTYGSPSAGAPRLTVKIH